MKRIRSPKQEETVPVSNVRAKRMDAMLGHVGLETWGMVLTVLVVLHPIRKHPTRER